MKKTIKSVKVGDVGVLNSGGPKMTVTSVDKETNLIRFVYGYTTELPFACITWQPRKRRK